ncbi:hypothetical protein [Chryseobacterium profundimaris]|uniref:ATP-binding protein n=1 Tax=Chryseobacterium profundimaris TaxID=1387275 RepID=A0ABY1NUU6_9FLAO|nr:hypothetical protein [Chryseobacterium profundimaris]SMP18136.1 hypothetical protein SAMN06264346_104214 [Chryseobacterium profundimaris]
MQIDIAGKVREKKLPNNKVLLPLYEAIVNSIHAIEDLKLDEKGLIEVELVRLNQEEIEYADLSKLPPIKDFIIRDNGIGFTEENYESFNFAHSSYKYERGGKGIGRITWLRAFDRAIIESQFKEKSQYLKRNFNFETTRKGIEKESVTTIGDREGFWSTTITLRNLKERYRRWCNNNAEDIVFKILEHCFSFFLETNCPRIVIVDGDRKIVVNDYFNTFIEKTVEKRPLVFNKNEFSIDIVKSKNTKSDNKVHLLANKREVVSFSLTEKVPEIPIFFTDINGEKYSISVYVSGKYLDENVNEERTEIIFDEENNMFLESISFDEFKIKVSEIIRSEFRDELSYFSEKKLTRVKDFVVTHPRYRHLLKYKSSEILEISNSSDDSKLEVELFKIQQKLELEVLKETKVEIENIQTKEDSFNDVLHEKILDVGTAKLSEYILHRKQILDLLDLHLKKKDSGYSTEEIIHSLIFPLRKTSDEISLEEHNLWVIDDKLSFHDYLASDKTFKSIERTESNSTKETDIVVFNKSHLLSDEKKPYSSIVIVEFKRPMRNDYTDKENPINQVNTYVREIINNKALDKDGRPFDIKDKTPIYAYIVCDLTLNMRKFAEDQNFTVLPDNDGYFNFNRNYSLYVEIISFDKLIRDSKKRNKVLFEKLNLPTT